MARRGQQTSLQERLEIGERAKAGQTDPEIARAMGLSVWTVRKWRRKGQRHGREGLVSYLGRPALGALAQSSPALRETVRQLRRDHPGWGALTIRVELAGQACWTKTKLPHRSRLAAFLKQEGLTRRYQRHQALPQPAAKASQVHEEWEVDAQGAISLAELGRVSVINVIDAISRLKVSSYPCLHTSHPVALDYQLVLRRAFVQYGLPQRISLDHDTVFYDNTSASPFPGWLHLWLIGLGIEVRFIEQTPPAEHSLIERTHQLMTQQAITGQHLADGPALEQNLTDRTDFLNRRFPSRSLGQRPPLLAYPEAIHSGRPYRLEWEESLLDLSRIYAYLAQGRWFRLTTAGGRFSLGAHRYALGQALANQTVEITFDPVTLQLCILPAKGPELRRPIQGFTKADLMGELSPLLALPIYQLALPFSPETWRQMSLAIDLTGTTF